LAANDESTAVDIPDRREQDLIHPTPTDIYYLFSVLFVLLAMLVHHFLPTLLSILIAILLSVGWAQTTYGRLYFYLGFVKPSNFLIDHFHKGIVWEAVPSSRLKARLRAPPITENLEINGIDDLAVAYNRKEKADTIIVGGLGSDVAAMVLPLQKAVDDRVTEVLKRIASGRDLQIQLSFLTSSRPQSALDVVEKFDTTLHPDFVRQELTNKAALGLTAAEVNLNDLPEERIRSIVDGFNDIDQLEVLLGREKDLHNNSPAISIIQQRIDDLVFKGNIMQVTDELLEWASTSTSRTRMALAITIRRDHILNKMAVKGESLAEDESEDPIILQIAQAAVDGIASCGVQEPHYYGVAEMHSHFRYAWDVEPDSSYHEWLIEHRQDVDYSSEEWNYLQWPQDAIGVKKNRRKRSVCFTDDCVHAVLLATNFPKEAEPHTFRPLYTIDVPNITVCTTGLVIGSGREVRSLDFTSAAADPIRESLGVVYQTQQSLERSQRRQERLEAAYRARYAFRFNMVFVISATNSWELERYVEETIRSIHTIDEVRVNRVKESFMLYPWMVRGTTGIPV
jgi:hypothetical protein